ncbi:MAG: DUF3106 domain-containing protein [Burkholderiaceae bacterium]
MTPAIRLHAGRIGAAIAVAAGLAVTALPAAHAADDVHADASRRPRASLLPRAGPIWSTLTRAQQELLAPFETQWNAWSAVEKRAWVVVADRYPTMSQAKQDALRTRIREWADLTPEQRRMARLNYRIVRNLPKETRDEEVRRYQALTPEERDALQTSSTSNTAARHAGSRTGLAKHASQPMPGLGVPRAITH